MQQVQVAKTHPIRVASIGHVGPYQELGPVYEALQAWISRHGENIEGEIREIGYDNPMTTPPEKCRKEVCVPVKGDLVSSDGVVIKTLPETPTISLVHEGSLDFESLGPSYGALFQWAAQQGKKTGHSIITYHTPPSNRKTARVEIALTLEAA